MTLLDRLFKRSDSTKGSDATEPGASARTPESERSGEGDQRTLDSASAEDVVEPGRIPGEGEELDRPPRSQ